MPLAQFFLRFSTKAPLRVERRAWVVALLLKINQDFINISFGRALNGLQGQHLPAQGNALGYMARETAPCKGSTFRMILPLQGEGPLSIAIPGRCPGLGDVAPLGRLVTVCPYSRNLNYTKFHRNIISHRS